MKKFTFIFVGLLFLAIGTVGAQTVLPLVGENVEFSNEQKDGSGNTISASVKLKGGCTAYNQRIGEAYLGGSSWATTKTSDQIHTFTVTLDDTGNEEQTLFLGAVSGSFDKYGTVNVVAYSSIETANDKVLTLVIDAGVAYDAVYLYHLGQSQWKTINVKSITRTITTASSVAAPTISPASSTYDGDLSVTIAKGANNTKVVYSVSGSNEDASNVEFTSAELTAGSKTLTLTGTGNITVTATGYKGGDASSEVKNTYTYSIPSGQSSTTSGLPHTFNSWNSGNSITFNNSFFSNIDTGDYVVFDVADVEKDGTVLGFRKGWSEDTYKDCTTTSGGNGAKGVLNMGDTQWWMKVNSDVVSALKNNEVRMQGGMVPDGQPNDPNDDISSSVTLNSLNVYECKVLNESSDNSTALSSKINHVVVELTRSFVKNMWNTVCLPFSLTPAQATQLFGSGYQLAEFTDVSGTTMKFTTAASFEAGVPYLVKPTIDVSNASPVVLVDVNITAKTPQTVPHGGYSFVGNFTQKTFSGGECNTSRFVATGNELMTPENGTTLKSLRCYFTVPATPVTPARSLTFDVDEEGNTTGVADINRETITNNGDFFNLAGQRVAQPTKGLYIVNGKKVVIK
jgi:hypothetical protein